MSKKKSIEKRAEKILKKLTLEEKIYLLGGEHNGTKEIKGKFPKIKFADGPVGVHWWCEKSTAYPALIALASTFNKKLARKFGWALGRDCRARGVHVLLAPGVNIYRSPLCGRNFEYLGEDPYLSAKIATNYIKGVQSQNVSATVKHFALNFQEYERHRVSSDADERTMREIYLPAFEAAVKDAKCGAVMTAYNLVNGQHCSENEFLIMKVLKGEWQFDGLVMSDWVSTYSTEGAANRGLDLEMPTGVFLNKEKLLPLIKKGIVTEKTIDEKVKRLIKLALRFDWLDREQKDDSIPLNDPETADVALNTAREGIVMLKNQNKFLPLKMEKLKNIAVIGYNAANPIICGGGSAYTTPYQVETLLDVIKSECSGKVDVKYEVGYDVHRHIKAFNTTKFLTHNGEKGIQGEYFDNNDLSGSPLFTKIDENINFPWGGKVPDERLKIQNYSVRWRGKLIAEQSGPHIFYYRIQDGLSKIIFDGKVISNTINANAVVNYGLQTCKFDLEKGKEYDILIEFKSRGGWCVVQFGIELENEIEGERQRAIELAKNSDVVIMGIGFTPETEGEGHDRPFKFHKDLERLLIELPEANPNIVVCAYAGGGFDMSEWLNKVKALLMLWYPGQNGTKAAVEILFGKTSPSGKLPITIEKRLEDRSSFNCYHDDDNDLRVQLADGIFCGYRGFDVSSVKPLFPFGYGLTYSEFKYKDLKLSSKKIRKNQKLKVSFKIQNIGKFPAAETAMLFISDLKCSYPRPVKELRGFEKVQLAPGQSTKVNFVINYEDLKFFNPDRKKWQVEDGKFRILIGSNSEDIKLSAEFVYKN